MQPNPYIYLPFAFIVSPLSPLSILPWPSVFTTRTADGFRALRKKCLTENFQSLDPRWLVYLLVMMGRLLSGGTRFWLLSHEMAIESMITFQVG